jgi:hypothetical protein
MYKLRDWVDETKLAKGLSCNERAVEYLENHEHLIDYYNIFKNPNAIHIIEKNIHLDKHSFVNYNINAINFLRNNPQYIYTYISYAHGVEYIDDLIKNKKLDRQEWWRISANPAAMHILNDPKYYKNIHWVGILYNKNAVEIVKNNVHMIKCWKVLCGQPHLIDIIEQNMDKIDWFSLSENYNAIHILEKNIEKINVRKLCCNRNGCKLLILLNHAFDGNDYYNKNIVFDYFDYCEKNNIPFNLIKGLSVDGYSEKHMEFLKHNNEYGYLSANPNIFEYDYKRMQKTRQSLPWYNNIKK